jgi:outer membrane biosynthesis protein TonB
MENQQMRKLARLAGGATALVLVVAGTSCGRQSQQNQAQQSEPQAPQNKAQQPETQQPQNQEQQAEPQQPPQNKAQQPETQQPQKQVQQAEPQQLQSQAQQPEPQQPQAEQPQKQAQPSRQSANQNSKQSGSQNATENPSQDDIRQIQQVLKDKGFNVGPLDGKLGKKTKQALSQFQRKQGLQQTGMPDVETLAALGIHDTHRAH